MYFLSLAINEMLGSESAGYVNKTNTNLLALNTIYNRLDSLQSTVAYLGSILMNQGIKLNYDTLIIL